MSWPVAVAVGRRWCRSLALAGAILGTPAADALAAESLVAAGDPAAFEVVPCWAPDSATASVRCGYLSVPESRERPNGRSIRVAVAILTPADAPAGALPSPLVHLAGGPGFPTGLSGDLFAYLRDWYASWPGAHDRTLILVDQRGTGESEPRLQCEAEMADRAMRAYYGTAVPRDPVEHAEWWRRHLVDCRAPFDAAGIDVTAYNMVESAADFAALRQALGITRWDVWGASYGTELALELLRIDEAGIRSLILDSVSLYQHPDIVPGNVAAAFDRALTQVFRDCLLDQACRNHFYGLSTSLGHGLAWLNLKPETLTLAGGFSWDGMQFVLDGRRMVELLFFWMYAPQAVPFIPATVSALHMRHHEQAEQLANYMLAMFSMVPVSELVQISTQCRAAPRGAALERLRDQEGRYPNYAVLWVAELYRAVCPGWQSAAADPAELGPVRSDVPALILGGRYDPVTPPEWGRIVAEWLPSSMVIEFPHLAHGSVGLDPCADRIAANFLDRPAEDPQDACFAELSPPKFLLP
jgi:pimeloyl-ACP methyl ester carboxylesterase